MGPLVWENSYSFKRFFWFYIQRKFISVRLYQLINRTSPEFQPMHAYGQQLWFLFHHCGPLLSFWTAGDRSYRNHQMKLIIIGLPGSRENQNTVEKNEFYEWRIWRTIMKTMSENSSICIKINSWFHRAPPALLSINRPPSITISLIAGPSMINGAPPASIPTTGPIQTNISIAGPLMINGAPPAPIPTTGPIQTNISIADPPEIKRGPRQHPFLPSAHTGQIWTFFSWNNPPKTTLYENFWWFSYRRIFPPIFLHELNFEFQFILSMGWINDQFWSFIHSWNRVIWRNKYWWLSYYKNSEKLYLDNKSVITNIGCIRTINLNQ